MHICDLEFIRSFGAYKDPLSIYTVFLGKYGEVLIELTCVLF